MSEGRVLHTLRQGEGPAAARRARCGAALRRAPARGPRTGAPHFAPAAAHSLPPAPHGRRHAGLRSPASWRSRRRAACWCTMTARTSSWCVCVCAQPDLPQLSTATGAALETRARHRRLPSAGSVRRQRRSSGRPHARRSGGRRAAARMRTVRMPLSSSCRPHRPPHPTRSRPSRYQSSSARPSTLSRATP